VTKIAILVELYIAYSCFIGFNNNNNNNIYFAKWQVQQKGKSPSKLATILRATKQKNTIKQKRENYAIYVSSRAIRQ